MVAPDAARVDEVSDSVVVSEDVVAAASAPNDSATNDGLLAPFLEW